MKNIFYTISVFGDILGIIALVLVFVLSYKTECFNIKDWYLTLSPIGISYISQIITLIIEKTKEE